jgi:hypothetical protein
MWEFDPWMVSQPVPRPWDLPGEGQKGPPMAGFRAPAMSLHVPNPRFGRCKLPEVSAQHREYSRFDETEAGDLVRSPLPTEDGSA